MSAKVKAVLAWHWLPEDGTLRYGDGRKVVVGEKLSVALTKELRPCSYGMHASTKILDALQYAPGPILTRVRLTGPTIIKEQDKCCAYERTALWMVDARLALVVFASDCAWRALERERRAGREPDSRCWAAVEAARRFASDPSDENRNAADAAYAACAAYADAAYAAYASCAASAACAAYADAAYADAAYAARAAGVAAAAERAWQSRRLRSLIGALRRGEKLVPWTGGAE
jgi:hypothetical protein